MLYRIITEDRNNQEYLAGLILRRFEGFNILKSTGYYKGLKENSLVIEIDTLEDDNEAGIYQLANDIKYAGKQEQVLLQIISLRSILI